jgi:hypothetical protein
VINSGIAGTGRGYERKGRGLTILPVVLIIFAGVVAAIYWQRSAITEFYRYIGSTPQSPAGQETSSVRPKFSGRVRLQQDRGQVSGPAAVGDQTAPAVAQRVVLYEEDPSDPHGKRYDLALEYLIRDNPNRVLPVLPATRASGPIGHDVCVKKRHVAEASTQHHAAPRAARRAAITSHQAGYTASFSSLAARNATFLLALILIASPVAGLRPIRAGRFLT